MLEDHVPNERTFHVKVTCIDEVVHLPSYLSDGFQPSSLTVAALFREMDRLPFIVPHRVLSGSSITDLIDLVEMTESRTYDDPFGGKLHFVDRDAPDTGFLWSSIGLQGLGDVERRIWLFRKNQFGPHDEAFRDKNFATSRAFCPVSGSCATRCRNDSLLISSP
jgi:hypothetical protein